MQRVDRQPRAKTLPLSCGRVAQSLFVGLVSLAALSCQFRTTLPATPLATDPDARIASLWPQGEDLTPSEVLVRFDRPLVPVMPWEALPPPPLAIYPRVEGHWMWLSTRELRFVPKTRFPMATVFEVTENGRRNAQGNASRHPGAFRFATGAPHIVWHAFDIAHEGQTSRTPRVALVFDQDVDPDKALPYLGFRTEENGTDVIIPALLSSHQAWPFSARLENESPQRIMFVTPARELPPDTAALLIADTGLPSREGPLKTKAPQTISFRTASPFRLLPPRNEDGSAVRQGESWIIPLSHPFDEKTPSVGIRPYCEGHYRFDSTDIHLDCENATAFTAYKVTVADVRDIFGRSLTSNSIILKPLPPKASLRFEDIPEYGAPHPVLVQGPSQPSFVTLRGQSVASLRVRVSKVAIADFPRFMLAHGVKSHTVLDLGQTISQREHVIHARAGREQHFKVPIPLEVGHYMLEAIGSDAEDRMNVPAARLWVQKTNLAFRVFAGRTRMHIWVNKLKDATPVPNAKIVLHPSRRKTETDNNGLAVFDLRPEGDDMIEVGAGGDSVMLPHDAWSSFEVAEDGKEAAAERPAPSATWSRNEAKNLYWYTGTDRQLYAPGDQVHFFGWLRRLSAGGEAEWSRLAGPQRVFWEAQAGDVPFASGQLPVTNDSGFAGQVTLPDDLPTGSVTLRFRLLQSDGTKSPAHEEEIIVGIYERPEMQTTMTLPKGPYVAGDPFRVNMEATYLSGGVVAGARWDVALESYYSWHPQPYEDYVFSARADDPDGSPQPVENRSSSLTLDVRGKASNNLRLPSPAKRGQPWIHLLNSEVQDVNSRRWFESHTLNVLPAKVLVGLRAQGVESRADSTSSTKATSWGRFVVVDSKGQLESGHDVELTLWREITDERDHKSRYERLWTQEVRSEARPVQIRRDNEGAGAYLLVAEVKDSSRRPHRSSIAIKIPSEPRPKAPSPEKPMPLAISWLDDAHGSTARYDAPKGFSHALFRFVRAGDILELKYLPAGKSGTIAAPPAGRLWGSLTAEMTSLSFPAPDSHIEGFASKARVFQRESHHLHVEVGADGKTPAQAVGREEPPTSFAPGDSVQLRIRASFPDGRPASDAELVVSVVDDAIFRLRPRAIWRDPFKTFYDESITSAGQIYERSTRELMRSGLSGGVPGGTVAALMRGAPSGPERHDFRPTAYFATDVRADRNGDARVEFRLPDSTTRYRIMVAAAAGNAAFGLGQSEIVATKELVLRPTPPAFLRAGDIAKIPLVLQNQSRRTLALSVTTTASLSTGTTIPLRGGAVRAIRLPPQTRELLLSELRVPETGDVMQLSWRADVTGSAGKSMPLDRISHTIPILSPLISEQMRSFGDGVGEQREGLIWPQPSRDKDAKTQASARLRIAQGALPPLNATMQTLCDPEVDTTEALAAWIWAASSWLPQWSLVANACAPDANVARDKIHDAWQRIAARTGGQSSFLAFSGRHVSAPSYVTHTLAKAAASSRQAGIDVPNQVLSRLQELNERENAQWFIRYQDCLEDASGRGESYQLVKRECDRSAVKGAPFGHLEGDESSRKLGDELRQTVLRDGQWRRAQLSSTLVSLWNWSKEPALKEQIRDDLLSRLSKAGDQAWVTDGPGATWPNGFVRISLQAGLQADVIEAWSASSPTEILTPLVRGLLRLHTGSAWGGALTTAKAVVALRSYQAAHSTTEGQAHPGGPFSMVVSQTSRSPVVVELEPSAAWDHSWSPLRRPTETLTMTPASENSGMPWSYAVTMNYHRLPAYEPRYQGFTAERELFDASGARCEQLVDGSWRVPLGARVKVTLRFENHAPRFDVLAESPYPAGFAAVDPRLIGQSYGHEHDGEARFADVVTQAPGTMKALASRLPAGRHEFSYVADVLTAGEFLWPEAIVKDRESPGIFGRTAASRVFVEPR